MTMPTGTVEGFWAQPFVHALGWTLVHFCWQGAAVAVLLWCALGLLEGREARVRYAAALCALGLMVAAPIATFAHIAAAEYRLRALLTRPVFDLDGGIVVQVGAGDSVTPWTVRAGAALDHACETTMPWLLLAWMAGVVVFVARLNLGLVVARRMRLVATEPAAEELIELFERLRRRIGVRRAVSLMQSAVVQVPTVIGWLRPVVLVPVSCLTGLSAVQIEAILAHELAHVRRHDYLVSVAQSVAEALLFYHPAVWWVSKQVRRERECCCDDAAVRMSGDRLAYARALSSLEEYRAGLPAMVLGANGGVLTMRIRRLLGLNESATGSRGAAIALLAATVVATGMYVGSVARAERGAARGSAAQVSPTQASTGSDEPGIAAIRPTAIRLAVQRTESQIDGALQEPRGVYKVWLDQDVVWIITPEERSTYLQLSSDAERDKFIAQFWERRNPTGAAANSFREEHYARIAYSNQHFAAGVPGWKTDRGHVYIAYGKPESIDSHPGGGSYPGVAAGVPFEVWNYRSAPGLGQNADLVFVDDCKCGNYRLISKLGSTASAAVPAILPDNPSVDMVPYLKRVYAEVQRNWVPLAAEQARLAQVDKAIAAIAFSIEPDGAIGSMELYGRSNYETLDRAAWQSIVKERTFPPLPKEFHRPKLELRLAFNADGLMQEKSGFGQTDLPAAASTATGASPNVSDVMCQPQVVGNQRIPTNSILARLVIRQGDAFDAAKVKNDFDSLWGAGYFTSVRIERVDTAKCVQLIVHVQEKPAVRPASYRPASNGGQASAPSAQGSGAIAGVVMDKTGAVIRGASVTATNMGTGFQTTLHTDDSGRYSFSSLPVGDYNVEVSAPGFMRLLQENVRVEAQQSIGLNLRLNVGQISQMLNVTGARIAPPIAARPVAALGAQQEPVRVSSGAMAGNLIERPNPVYPPIAKAAHVQGSVVLHAIISKTGTVENLSIISGPPMLTASAKDAVKRWVYKPYLLNGEPVEVETAITVNFTFGDAAPPLSRTEQGLDAAPLRVSSGAMAGSLISKVDPVYPADARAAGIQGSVVLRAVISKTGDIEDLKVISGPMELTKSAIDAVKQWKYRPYLLNGEPVEVDTTITVNYSLVDGAPPPPPPGSADVRGPQDDLDASGVQPKRIGNGVSAPLLVVAPAPEMSDEAKRDKVSGNVLLNLWVDENGNPTHVRVRRGVGHGLDEKAVEAVKQYRFKPAMEDGKPVTVSLNVEVNFQIF